MRFITREVQVGSLRIGGTNPIRVQSMTTADTMDTEGSVNEAVRMIEAGCELVRLTAPSKKDAENLRTIKEILNNKGYNTPLVADIHFTPNAADVAANYVEKIRINPGNYADKKKFEEHSYTDVSYQQEIERIEEKFTPLILKCKLLNRAMRIGTNHGSLSDRILSRYGDTPQGMVESAMEFIRICEKNDFRNFVISMKASNTLVMVQAYRLLVKTMLTNNQNYPIHLGVTEAGDGEDGRIKSAVGIGALLEDGIGDTIRVSLTENSEYEIPVAQKLIHKFSQGKYTKTPALFNTDLTYSPYEYKRRESVKIENVGDKNVPIVVADLSIKKNINPSNLYSCGYSYSVPLNVWNKLDQAADVLYVGKQYIDFETPSDLRLLQDFEVWQENSIYTPLVSFSQRHLISRNIVRFLLIDLDKDIYTDCFFDKLLEQENAILVIETQKQHKTPIFRQFRMQLDKKKIKNPVVFKINSHILDQETFQLHTSSDLGVHFIDGFGDGLWISANYSTKIINSLSFGILQATRTRISKTEYISCPSCGRTLFDLQEITAKIRERTSHLKGIKIGIMGCIVNGPGEMADADYGYVGVGHNKINLYKEKNVVQKNVPEHQAVEALINLIAQHGDWKDAPNT